MKEKARTADRTKPATYVADRGDFLPFEELETSVLNSITDTIKGPGLAASADIPNLKSYSRAEAKGLGERVLACLNLHQESLHEDSK